MKIKTVVTLLSIIICINSYAQNETPLRSAFTLKLPVDGKQFYEQEVPESPFFVKKMYFKYIQERRYLSKLKHLAIR
jgi:hypothetical protein